MPASGSSSLPNTEGESYRGKQSQSMDPLLDTSAAELQSASRP